MEKIEISVIIPTRNRCILLDKTLESILYQNYLKSKFEVIVVDNGSTDNTKEICEKYRNLFINFQYCYEDELGLHVGRNLGYMLSKAEILVYADDDIKANTNWLKTIFSCFQLEDSIAIVGGDNSPIWEVEIDGEIKKLWGKTSFIPVYSIYELSRSNGYIDPFLIWGCNFSVRKKIIEKAKGFHPDGMPTQKLFLRGDGETYISNYIKENNHKAFYHKGASVKHFVSKERISKKYFIKWYKSSSISNGYKLARKAGGNVNILIVIKLFINAFFSARKYFMLGCWELSLYAFYGYIQGTFYYYWHCLVNKKMKDWILKESYFNDKY